MPTFTPPTYEQSFMDEPGADESQGLMRYYSFPVGYSVLITGGVATPHPGRTAPTSNDIAGADTGSGETGKAAFLGGRTYEVSDVEGAVLQAAGYAVLGLPPFPRFQSIEPSLLVVTASFPTATIDSGVVSLIASTVSLTPTFGTATIANATSAQLITASLLSVSPNFPFASISTTDASTYSDTYSDTY